MPAAGNFFLKYRAKKIGTINLIYYTLNRK